MTELVFEREKKLLEYYAKQEVEIETKLKQLSARYHSINIENKRKISTSQAEKKAYQKRNELLLKSLEVATAKLRTQFFYCPTDRGLEKAKRKYIETIQEAQSSKRMEAEVGREKNEIFL